MSEILIEKLLEQRDYYLNTLKHISFELALEPSENEIIKINNLRNTAIEQLKKIEQEIVFLSSDG